jgi:hypothetical protein
MTDIENSVVESNTATNKTDEESEAVQDEYPSREITLPLILAYLGGLIAVLNFIGALVFFHLSIVLFAVAIAVSLPPAKRRVERAADVSISTAASIVLYILATFIGNTWFVISRLTG